jgi:hypothetical protein
LPLAAESWLAFRDSLSSNPNAAATSSKVPCGFIMQMQRQIVPDRHRKWRDLLLH